MFLRESRYRDQTPFNPDKSYLGVRARQIGPATGVIEHTITSGDRLDLLARHYYNDDRLWWRILDANPDILHGGDLCMEDRVGETILISRGRE